MSIGLPRLEFVAVVVLVLCGKTIFADESFRAVGPQTEKRFPPLTVPAGFKATLFACDPLVEYPSVIAAGPRPGAIYVAYDYMTGLGTEIVRRDEVRLVEDTDGDGYADKSTLYAGGFNSIMGLAYHEGIVYVMHAPYLTALRDTKGTGTADERKDLLTGLGLEPEKNPVRLHCANGVTVGHDGWLYLAMGDNGTNVLRPEGDRLILNGGGILRCRPDGRDLHVFASGLRNIYDVALDAELNVFVRDNENDGGTYKIRVCHSFHGADHGYPFLYEARPDEALPPLADLGLGSSAGGVCYLETQFPAEYRGNLINCEWGKSIVRYPLARKGSTFARRDEIEFAVGATNDPYGFKPTDVVVQRDGTLMISDWCDGQRPMRGRGRIYHVAYAGEGATPPSVKPIPKDAGPEFWIEQLNSESYTQRCDGQRALERLGKDGVTSLLSAMEAKRLEPRGRLHAVWIMAQVGGAAENDRLLKWAQSDPDPSVRAQAVRAIADLADPVFTQHKLDAGPGDAALAKQLATFDEGHDPRVILEAVIALGRLKWKGMPNWAKENLWIVFGDGVPGLPKPEDLIGKKPLRHVVQQALRRSKNWPGIFEIIDDEVFGVYLQQISFAAIADHYETAIVDGLIKRLRANPHHSGLVDALARVYKKPGPWTYWGYRPGARPANTVPWERTEAIAAALNGALARSDYDVRKRLLQHMQREKVPVAPAALYQWLAKDPGNESVATIMVSLGELPRAEALPHLASIARNVLHSQDNRLAALALIGREKDQAAGESLRALVQSLEDSHALADAIRRIAEHREIAPKELLVEKASSYDPYVRAAAIEALGKLRVSVKPDLLATLLADKVNFVRRAAAVATGVLQSRDSAERLMSLAADPDFSVRRASLDSLRQLGARSAVPLAVAALEDRQTSAAALELLRELGGPEQSAAVVSLAQRSPSAETTVAVVRVLSQWNAREKITSNQHRELDNAVAEIHGTSGLLVRWESLLLKSHGVSRELEDLTSYGIKNDDWRFASGTEARLSLGPKDSAKDAVWFAHTTLSVPESTDVEFLASSSGSLEVWQNGKSLYRRDKARNLQIDSDRFSGTLAKGHNRLLVQVGPTSAAVEFHLRFRRKSASADHERLARAALSRPGNVERGKLVAQNIEKSQCLKCHRLGDQGERFGPELTGVGSRFSRIYLTESILNPSRTIAPSFGTLSAVLKDGLVVSGVKVAESETMLTLADNQGRKHVLAKNEIEELQASPVSTMPEGLEKRLSDEEFLDLIAYLASLKEVAPTPAATRP